jgi:hypothetical protein
MSMISWRESLRACGCPSSGVALSGWLDMAAIAEGVWGRKVHPLRVPALLLDGLAYANLGLSRLLGYAPMLTPSKLRELRHPDWVVNNQAFTEATGWHPQVTLRSGLEQLKCSIG